MGTNMIFNEGDLVEASLAGDYDQFVYGWIESVNPLAGVNPVQDYVVNYFAPNDLVVTPLITAEIRPRRTKFAPQAVAKGQIQPGDAALGSTVTISQSGAFTDTPAVEASPFSYRDTTHIFTGRLFFQDILPDRNIFGIKIPTDEEGVDTIRYAGYAKLVKAAPKPTPKTNKSQLYGLLTRLENLIEHGDDTAAALRGLAALYADTLKVKAELKQIREALHAWKE